MNVRASEVWGLAAPDRLFSDVEFVFPRSSCPTHIATSSPQLQDCCTQWLRFEVDNQVINRKLFDLEDI